MQKPVVRAAIVVPLGIAIALLGGAWTGSAIALFGLVSLAIQWRFRDSRPIDPVLLADVDEMMKLEKSDPAAADQLLERALADADRREEQELADLRRRAISDPQVAFELRNRLRAKLKTGHAARRKAEKWALDSPNGAAVLKEMDLVANGTQRQLAQAEQLVTAAGTYPFFRRWRNHATESLRLPESLPHGGRSGWYVTLAAGAGILAIVALMPMGSDAQARVAMSGIGVMSAVLVLSRPQGFWESPRVQDWRSIMGDRPVVLIYLAIGLLFIGAAWLTHI